MNVVNNIVTVFKQYFADFYIPKITAIDVFEMVFIMFAFYFIAKTLKNTRSWAAVKGGAAFGVFYLVARLFSMNVITKIMESLFLFLLIVLAIMLAPELRKWLETIVNNKIAKKAFNFKSKKNEYSIISDNTIRDIVKACDKMSEAKTGAIIVYENKIPLNDIISTGIPINSDISTQLILNIFEKNTPLHDGAVVISNDKIKAATCYLPVSDDKKISKKYGTRHRAAAGLSETTDALVIVVSEETGDISITRNGSLKKVTKDELTEILYDFKKENTQVKKRDIKTLLFGNIMLKIMSVLVSLTVWFVMVNTSNPVITTTFYNVPVTIINEDAISEYGKTYFIESSEKVNVTVKGHRSIVDSILPEDIKVYGDLSKLSGINTTQLYAVVEGYDNVETKISDDTLDIELVNFVSKGFIPSIVQTGEHSDDYYIDSIEPTETAFTVSGAEDLIKTIDRVECVIDITEIRENTTFDIVPVIYDKNGNIISQDKLKFDKEKVEVNVSVFKTKNVDISIAIEAGEANGFIERTYTEPSSIKIAAPDETLAAIENIDITMPMTLSPETLEKESFNLEVDITKYVADYIRIPESNKNVSITIEFKKNVEKTFSYTFNDIEIRNLTDDMTVTSEDTEFYITVIGEKNLMLQFNEIKPYINAYSLQEGDNSIKVMFSLPEGITIQDNQTHIFNLEIQHSNEEPEEFEE